MYDESKIYLHEAFSVVLVGIIFSESAAGKKGSGKQGGRHGVSAVGLKRMEDAMTRVADLMTKKFVATKQRQGKRTEKMQLEEEHHDTLASSLFVFRLEGFLFHQT